MSQKGSILYLRLNILFIVGNSIVDGLESCQRCISVSGHGCSILLDNCWIRDMFSVITVTETDNVSGLGLTIQVIFK